MAELLMCSIYPAAQLAVLVAVGLLLSVDNPKGGKPC